MQELDIIFMKNYFYENLGSCSKCLNKKTPPYINEMFNLGAVNEYLPVLQLHVSTSSNFGSPRPNREINKASHIQDQLYGIVCLLN